GQAECLGMLSQQAHSTTAVAGHLPEQPAEARARMITDPYAGRKETSKTRALDPIVEFDIFTSVELLVKQAHGLDDTATVGYGNALRAHELLRGRIDVRVRIVAQPGSARGRDSPLQRSGAFNVQRLRPTHAIGAAPGKHIGKLRQILRR